MGWIIFGVIAFCITLFLWKNSYRDYDWAERDEEYTQWGHIYTRKVGDKKVYKDKFRMPLWLLIVGIIGYLTPIVNIILFLVFIGTMIGMWVNGDAYLHFQKNSLMSKICSFFNKDVF